MGKFFNGKVKKRNSNLLKYVLIGAGILLAVILAIIMAKKAIEKNKKIEILPKEKVVLEINSEYPDVDSLFIKIKNLNKELIKVDYNGLNMGLTGEYIVIADAGNSGKYEIPVSIVDTQAPNLVLKEKFEIESGKEYTITDFIISCDDNSKEECKIEYMAAGAIDFSSFTEDGTYEIYIIATDVNGNTTESQKTTLIIGNSTILEEPQEPQTPEEPQEPQDPTIMDPIPETCKFGSLEPDKNQYDFPVAYIAGDKEKGCAIDRDLWDNDEIQNDVYEFFKEDNEKLKTELNPIIKQNFPNGANTVVQPKFLAVLNENNKGLVGYGIFVEVYIADSSINGAIDSKENLKLSYYLNSDLSRKYVINAYKVI